MITLSIWLPYNHYKKNKEDHVSIVTSLLSRQRNYLFFKNIIDRWWKTDHLWQCSVQKAVFCQRWISAAYNKGRISRKKSHALSIVRSWWHYSLRVFKPQSDTQCRFILLTAAKWAWKTFKKMPPTCQYKICASPSTEQPHSARIMQKKILDLSWSLQLCKCK